jgi:hypothetical protein
MSERITEADMLRIERVLPQFDDEYAMAWSGQEKVDSDDIHYLIAEIRRLRELIVAATVARSIRSDPAGRWHVGDPIPGQFECPTHQDESGFNWCGWCDGAMGPRNEHEPWCPWPALEVEARMITAETDGHRS